MKMSGLKSCRNLMEKVAVKKFSLCRRRIEVGLETLKPFSMLNYLCGGDSKSCINLSFNLFTLMSL